MLYGYTEKNNNVLLSFLLLLLDRAREIYLDHLSRLKRATGTQGPPEKKMRVDESSDGVDVSINPSGGFSPLPSLPPFLAFSFLAPIHGEERRKA